MSSATGLFWIALGVAAVGCGAGDNQIDPGDLELRDLLGVTPDAAALWDPHQRESARRVIEAGLHDRDIGAQWRLERAADGRARIDDRVARSLALHDSARAEAGDGALAVVRVEFDSEQATARRTPTAIAVAAGVRSAPTLELWISDPVDGSGRALDVLAALASDAGHTDGPVIVALAPRLPVIASYVVSSGAPPRLLVNPVVAIALGDPVASHDAVVPTSAPSAATGSSTTQQPATTAAAGNPYSFYGSVAECAFAQRTRCESCLGTATCEAITTSTGDAECEALAADAGRGYFLICANLALAIVAVERCTADAAPGCARDVDAASKLDELANNSGFVDDANCGGALDGCLAKVFGAPPEPFPGLDAGVTAPRAPRSTNVSCGDSCSNDTNNNNCEANPSCGEGPSCNNSLSCDSACSNSNDQSGCGGNCNACSEDDSGSGGSSGCGGSDGDGGGGCGGDSGGSGCGDCGSSGSCDSCGGNGGSSGCATARHDPSAGAMIAMSLAWGLLPIPAAALVRRRARRSAASTEPR